MIVTHIALQMYRGYVRSVTQVWYSRSTRQRSNGRHSFVTFTENDCMAKVSNIDFIKLLGYRTVKLTSAAYGQTHIIHLYNVLYVPKIAYNLISLSQARMK